MAETALWLRAFLPFALAYLLSFGLRSVTAVAAPEIARELLLGPRALGVLTSAYFLGYACMQLPAGVLLDRLGPRRTDGGLFLLAALGALLYGLARGTTLLGIGRLLVGIGTSAGLIAGFRAHALFFPPARLPLMNGLLMAFGGLGAMLATTPAEALIAATSWRVPFLLLAALSLAVAALIWLAAPERASHGGDSPLASSAAFRRILCDRLFRHLMPVTVLTQATLLAYQTLWAGPWLSEVDGLAPRAVAGRLLALSAAMTVGFVATGAAAPLLGRLGLPPVVALGGGVAAFLGAQAWLAFAPPALAQLAWIPFGFFGTASVLAFAILIRHLPAAIGGRASGLLNFTIFIGAFALQAGIGHLVALLGGGAFGHRGALRLILALEVIAALWLLAGLRPGLTGSEGHAR